MRAPAVLRRVLVPVTAALTALTLLIPVPVQAAGDWAGQAPFTPQVRIDLVHTVYYPREMGRDGLRHPVVLWGNGTGAIPGVYSGLLRHYARQGFVVVAVNTPTSNFAISMRWGIDLMERENADPRSVFFRKVDLGRIAAAGHSQGGSAAINAALDKRVGTVVAMAPGPLNDPALVRDASILYLAGEHDPIVWPALVRAMYRRSGHVPAGYLEMRGASHLEAVPSGGSMRAPSTAWLRYWLFDDDRAGRAFFGEHCGYCVDRSVVTVFERNRAAQRPTAR